MAWDKIGCAVDFSESSRVAMEEAARLARREGAELTLVHSYAPPPAVAMDMLVSPADLGESAAAELESMLTGWQMDAEALSGHPVQRRLLVGEPAEQILQFAREHGFDLLVVGTHGRTGVRRLVLGSVAERLVRLAPCPVLVVRSRKVTAAEEIEEEAAQHR